MQTQYYDQLQTPILVVDQSCQVTYFNHICPTFFKLPPRKLAKVGPLTNLISSEADLKVLIERALQTNTSQVSEEILIRVPEAGGDEHTVIIKAVPLDGSVVLNFWDLSIEKQLFEKYKRQVQELRQTHAQIVKSDKLTALGELISGIGHEISNPMTIVGSKLRELQQNIDNGDQLSLRKTSSDLESSFLRINKIISNLQSFVRNQEDALEICSLDIVIKDSIKFVSELQIANQCQIEYSGGNAGLFLGNELKLQQVLINLLKNSMDAIKGAGIAHGKIQIQVSENFETQMTVVKLFDNGPGVAKGQESKIFEMFYTTKELGEGTGLGLAISQKIVEAHHGSLSCVPSDKGACFELELPLLEIESFSLTNRYLAGEVEIEDPKILILGQDPALLGELMKGLQGRPLVQVYSYHTQMIHQMLDFFGISCVLDTMDCGLQGLTVDYYPVKQYCNAGKLDWNGLNSILSNYEGQE